MYLTYDEYTAISANPVPLEDFPQQLAAASFTLDSITNYFYSRVNLEEDYTQRKNAFKRAVAVTMDYYNANGSFEQFNMGSSQSVTIGRTSMTEGNTNTTKSQFGNVPIDVNFILAPTGLLFKGVSTIC